MSKTTDEKGPVEVVLDRCFTYEGQHYGPGKVRIKGSRSKSAREIADQLTKRMGQLKRHEDEQAGRARQDAAVTGIREPGTDPEYDAGPRAKPKADLVEEEMFTFEKEQRPASELFEKSDKELKKGGLKKKDIKRLRKLEEEQAAKADEEDDSADDTDVEEGEDTDGVPDEDDAEEEKSDEEE